MKNARKKLIIIGAGGQSRVVFETAQSNNYDIIGFVDATLQKNSTIMGKPVLGNDSVLKDKETYKNCSLHIAIGDPNKRHEIANQLKDLNYTYATLIHSKSYISPSATIGEGNYIGPHAVIHSHATLENHIIANTGCIIEHDCFIQSYVNISPAAVITGAVHIGEKSIIGANATILPGVQIASGTLVKAGSLYTNEIPS